jgi:SAM-dependent methyltransferase
VGLSVSGMWEALRARPREDGEKVVWHDLECGLYRADLALWRELAETARVAGGSGLARVLDVGAGTGRVALELARAGCSVTALDLDGELLGALGERAQREGLGVETVQGDARTFALERGAFGLCVAPMQTLQLLGGPSERVEFLRRAGAHLRAGGLLACAIVTELEPFDCDAGDGGPSSETTTVDGVEYVSRARSVRLTRRTIRIERERLTVDLDEAARVGAPTRGAHAPEPERDVIELDRVSVVELRREGLDAGLSFAGVREVPATEEHVGSEVVIFRA